MTPQIKSYAFYLPQFHPIAENDEWWGKGFTEWRNVAKARPLYSGHQQPRLPADLGFYDLRLPEVREQQAELARSHNIDGFIYYHYWFNGRRLLNRPFDEVLENNKPDFPFALCWANENWQRNWDGFSGEMLLEQQHSEEDDEDHIEYLLKAFADPRYIRVDGKPLFLIYRAARIPNVRKTLATWRQRAFEAGIGELMLCRVESDTDEFVTSPTDLGFDAAIEFGTEWRHLGAERTEHGLQVNDFLDTAHRMLKRPQAGYKRFSGVMTGFDNSPRNQKGIALEGSTPETYREWVGATVQRDIQRNPDASEIPIFVNAWNEWAEGAILEPCDRWGTRYLEAHAAGVADGATGNVRLKALADEQFPELTVAIATTGGAEQTMNTMQSVLNTVDIEGNIEFVVIDNGSHDETAAMLTALADSVRSVRFDEAVDAATAWRGAVRLARSNRVLLLSNDVELQPGAFASCKELLDKSTMKGSVSIPVITNERQLLDSGKFDSYERVAALTDIAASRTYPTAEPIVAAGPGVKLRGVAQHV